VRIAVRIAVRTPVRIEAGTRPALVV